VERAARPAMSAVSPTELLVKRAPCNRHPPARLPAWQARLLAPQRWLQLYRAAGPGARGWSIVIDLVVFGHLKGGRWLRMSHGINKLKFGMQFAL